MRTSIVILIAIILGLFFVLGFYPLKFYIFPLFALSFVLYLFEYLRTIQSYILIIIISVIYCSIILLPTIVIDFWIFLGLSMIHILGTFLSLWCIYLIVRKQVPDLLKVILIPIVWVIPEVFYLSKQLPWLFPFPILGYTQSPPSPLAHNLGTGSVILLSFFVLSVNVLVYLFIKSIFQRKTKWFSGIACIALIVFICSIGPFTKQFISSNPMNEKNTIDIVCVQGGITDWMYVVQRFDKMWQQVVVDTYLNLTKDAFRGSNKPNLVILPETALTLWVLDTELKDELIKMARENNSYILAGMPVLDGKKQYNSAV